ncbi:MAG: hypothetical protein EOO67_18910, partial [Microbacterium sp.]
MHFEDDGAARLLLRDADAGTVLAEYVYAPAEPPLESPRPYALLRSTAGAEATAYRPDDHVWHKGLSVALPVVGSENFWGGPTYVHGEGYVQLANNGSQVHRAFLSPQRGPESRGEDGRDAHVTEVLDWIAEDGRRVLSEERRLRARRLDAATWALSWHSALRNETDGPLGFGSPTSKGRENAGYAGIFWRGPSPWTGGEIVGPGGVVGDAARGAAGPWLAFVDPSRTTGVLVVDTGLTVTAHGNPWFARSEEYAGLNPAPFFYEETTLAPGETLVLAAVIVVGEHEGLPRRERRLLVEEGRRIEPGVFLAAREPR